MFTVAIGAISLALRCRTRKNRIVGLSRHFFLRMAFRTHRVHLLLRVHYVRRSDIVLIVGVRVRSAVALWASNARFSVGHYELIANKVAVANEACLVVRNGSRLRSAGLLGRIIK